MRSLASTLATLALPLALLAVASSVGLACHAGGPHEEQPHVGEGDPDPSGNPPPPIATDAGSSTSEDAASTPDPPGPPLSPNVDVSTETLVVGTTTNEFVLAVPKDYSPSRVYPLVLVLHGDGGNGGAMRSAYPIDAYSDRDAIVAYPSSTSSVGWNLYYVPASNQDESFLVALVASLVGRFSIDATKVFATGYSSGAFMINQMACRHSGLLRAIAPHAGGAPDEPIDPTATQWPNGMTKCAGQSTGVAAMVFHGMADSVVHVASGEYTASYWAYVNGCADTTSATTPDPCVQHDGCPTGLPVRFCAIPGLPHLMWSEGMKHTWEFFASL